jgi:hypothetical protein
MKSNYYVYLTQEFCDYFARRLNEMNKSQVQFSKESKINENTIGEIYSRKREKITPLTWKRLKYALDIKANSPSEMDYERAR